MAIEGATHINDLDVAKPSGATEQVLTLDDYHRQIKEVLKRDVNNFTGTALVYGADAANTNAYAFSSALTITTYTVGITCLLDVTNASTGASTLNIDGVGVKTIVNAKGVAIAAGEIAAGLNVMTYDGTNFVLSSYSTDPSMATLTGTQTLTNKTLTTPTLTTPTLTSPVLNTGVSGTAVDTDSTMAANSDTLLASQKAVAAHVATEIAARIGIDSVLAQANNGYIIFEIDATNGIMVQWAKEVDAGSAISITFSPTFSATPYSLVATNHASGNIDNSVTVNSLSSSSCSITSGGTADGVYWIAIGPVTF